MAKTEKNTPSVKLGVPVGGGACFTYAILWECLLFTAGEIYIKDVVHIYYTHFWQGETMHDLIQMYDVADGKQDSSLCMILLCIKSN